MKILATLNAKKPEVGDIYNQDNSNLYNALLKLRKDKFDIDEKIVIHIIDYISHYYNSSVSITVHNLLSVIRKVDISLSNFIFVTTYSNLEKEIEYLITDHNDLPTVYLVKFNLSGLHQAIDFYKTIPIEKNIKKSMFCLMAAKKRPVRMKLAQFFKHHQLTNVEYTFRNSDDSPSYLEKIREKYTNQSPMVSHNKQSINNDNDLKKLIPELLTLDLDSLNELWIKQISSPFLQEVNDVVLTDVDSKLIRKDTISFHSNDSSGPHNNNFYSNFAINIVTEPVFDYSDSFFTEKTWTAISSKTAIIMFGPKGNLAMLRSLGFKTFNNFWDESYDDIDDPEQRFIAVCRVILEINKLSLAEVKELYQKMEPILEHNRINFFKWIDNEVYPLYNKFICLK